ncbi:hypothetical protein QUF84_00660 [Fictibacillus enclensis]|uniref:hypothetical protein n=1 Tax=Fictibacillus enclensis TaxID=1017270 RepID=UPI0025A023F4|nr:hypothetical protein [Fictibacillus enclensis]MDM5335808.1 hypothetical protein [Fictibacillus enclensis]
MSDKKPRLSLTANKMPEDVYRILAEKGDTRRLTPYVVSLVEKEHMMDTLIMNLSKVVHKIDDLEETINGLKAQLDGSSILSPKRELDEKVVQGNIGISENIDGGIEEEIEEVDF